MLKDKNGETPLDKALEASQQACIYQILKLVAGHSNAKSVFGDQVEKHFCDMIRLGINLKEYLDSGIHLIQITGEKFPNYHPNDAVRHIPLSLGEGQSVDDIKLMGDTILSKEEKAKNNKNFTGGHERLGHPIEYILVNMSSTMKLKKKFMQALSESKDDTLFGNKTVQEIINFKWKACTEKFFLI